MQAPLSFVLLIGLVVSAQTSAQHFRATRQASRSCDPATESCVLLTSCPQLMKLLSPPRPANIRALRSSKCGTAIGRDATFCCPTGPPTDQGSLTPTSGESLLPRGCGRSLTGDRIHGGTPADLGEYPWIAVLGFQNDSSDPVEWNCGGSLLNERYVLTAAHCLRRPDRRLTVIRLGENNLETDKDCRGSDKNKICAPDVLDLGPEEVVVHPGYETRGFLSDDVALIRLDRPVEATTFIQPVCLPGPEDSFEGLVRDRSPAVIGFGVTEFGRRSTQLLEVSLPVVAREKCRAAANYATTLIEGGGQVCLGGQFQQDACMKDSGGPAMVTQHLNGPPYVQVGGWQGP